MSKLYNEKLKFMSQVIQRIDGYPYEWLGYTSIEKQEQSGLKVSSEISTIVPNDTVHDAAKTAAESENLRYTKKSFSDESGSSETQVRYTSQQDETTLFSDQNDSTNEDLDFDSSGSKTSNVTNATNDLSDDLQNLIDKIFSKFIDGNNKETNDNGMSSTYQDTRQRRDAEYKIIILTRFVQKCPKLRRTFIVIIFLEEIDKFPEKPIPHGSGTCSFRI